MSQAQQTQRSTAPALPGEEMTLNEMLRVMDVAREMGRDRATAEKMFARRGVRAELREKLVRTARLSGDQVTEAEIEAAIDQYFQNLHVYRDPPASWSRVAAYAWIWRTRLAIAAVGGTAALWWLIATLF
ncbi:DUF6384 family protein [Roseimaritima sediminicola]|uniref:DUF6384 family protein n=1 Tax=Roseimaritima sediminicola TaxID=2662066 RepID=UPI0012983B94|nr:DUF6384 family protein [Roseimaritima sediminicola]